jgi:excisionase family DNA binding protein
VGIAAAEPRGNTAPIPRPLAQQASAHERRLLDLPAAAVYLALSPWTLRELVANGTLRRVRVPLPNGGELRRVLLDREDLDQLIARWKA